jgi:hypothetical protein
MRMPHTVFFLIVFGGSVIPSCAESIRLHQSIAHQLVASFAPDVRDVNAPTFSVNDEVTSAIGEFQSETPEHAIGDEVAEPVATTGSNGMRTALARISEPASLALMGGGTVALAAHLARRKRRRDGRLWDRRRSRRRGYY